MVQIRCYACHMPFALSRDTVHSALDQVTEEGLSHFNAYCPRCRKANRISRERLQKAAPEWNPTEAEEEQTAAD